MRKLLLILLSFILLSCGHRYENTATQKALFKARQSEPFDTLIGVFTSSTGSLDLSLIQGQLSLPHDIKLQLYDTLSSDIKVCGNFPKELIDMSGWQYNPNLAYKIIGKTILADTQNAIGSVPLCYVTDWTKFNYAYHNWVEKSDTGTYPKRREMVDDILKHLKLERVTIQEIETLLGTPDYVKNNEMGYIITEDYGKNIEPGATTALKFKWNADSIITGTSKTQWKQMQSDKGHTKSRLNP